MLLHDSIVDLTVGFPRSPRERLDGIDILARAIDKARAELAGRLGDYVYWQCGVNRVLFTVLGVSDDEFLAFVRATSAADREQRHQFVRDVGESLEAPAALNDQQLLDGESAAAIDNGVVAWVRDVLRTPRADLDSMNAAFERMGPQTPEQRAQFDAELEATGSGRRDISTYAGLLDLQEGRVA